MNIEVLISTMHQSNMDIFNSMNIKSDALAINQYNDEYKSETVIHDGNVLRMICVHERGLSRSRNLAIQNSTADICVIADEDLVYRDDYAQTIMDAYKQYPEADIIAFSVPCSNAQCPTNIIKHMNVNALESMKLCSVQLTFKRDSIIGNKISFNNLFGAGSFFISGEENIFLIECIKKGLKIMYINKEIAIVNHNGSTWFKGFNELYFRTKGAMFYEMSSVLWLPLVLQYIVRKYKLYQRDITLLKALKCMFIGRSKYKSILLKGRNDHESVTADTQNHPLLLVWEKAKE